MKRFFIYVLFVALSMNGYSQPADFTWTTPSKNSSESMPCGGGSIGMNVWVENGDILFYLSRSGAFDENNTLLKQGRVRIKLIPALDCGEEFRQTLHLNDGYVEITDGKKTVEIWADVFKPVVHVDVKANKAVTMEATYENWRTKDIKIGKRERFQTSYKFASPKGLMTRHDSIISNPPMTKVMRKEARHTQRWDRASGVPLEILEHIPPKASDAAAVDLHLIEQSQQGGNQNGNESDVNGNQVLGEAGDEGQQQQNDGAALAAHNLGQLLGQNVSNAGSGDSSGKSAQQDVGQSGVSVVSKAAGQDAHSIDQRNATDQSADHGSDDQRHQNIQLAQAQNAEDDNRYEDGVEENHNCTSLSSLSL